MIPRIFIGFDAVETVAYHVLAHSILRRATQPVAVIPLVRDQLTRAYWRPRGATESTDFSLTRFLVPYLAGYAGLAMFMDCDMLCQTDVSELFESIEAEPGAVWVAPHAFAPTAPTKFLGRTQTAYPRKCWSSLMVFNCAHPACQRLTPSYVNGATGLELHRLQWVDDADVERLDLDWGWLVGVYAPNPDARVLHWTDGGPWFESHRDADHADLWRRELASLIAPLPVHAPVTL